MRVAISSREGERLYAAEVPRRLLLGRQDIDAKEPPAAALLEPVAPNQLPKLIFASDNDVTVSRRQLLLEQNDEELMIRNLSATTPVESPGIFSLAPQQERVVKFPVHLTISGYLIQISPGGPDDEESYEMLNEPIALPGRPLATQRVQPHLTAKLGSLRSSFKGEAHEDLLVQLENVIQTLQQAAASDQFLRDIVMTAAAEVELDEAIILMRSGDGWRVEAQAGMNRMSIEGWQPAGALLSRMAEQRKAFRRPIAFDSTPDRTHIVASMVAVPILDNHGLVIGALYGHRYAPSPHIGRMDVRLAKLLATGAAAALVRVEQEKRIIKTKVLFEQFVTPRVAHHIIANPQVLAGQEVDASFLFCDIAGFSRITERLKPKQTVAWINDVLETLSQCVLREEGTLVDYVGDELFAMFGSPLAQQDHASRACRAGLSILKALQDLNSKWRTELQQEMGLGIGVNTGKVLVGNIGSMTKLKFGAHGTPVNIASRVQSATRYLRTEFLATAETVSRLDPTFERRRICQVRMKNLEQPVSLYELRNTLPDSWRELKTQYEEALVAWESGKVQQAFRILGRLAAEFPNDGPTLALLQRSMEATQTGRPSEIVWELPGK